jgi:excisionase family DNA binding protein
MSDVLTLAEAAEYLGISKMSVTRYFQKGEIPGRKIGSIYLFHRTVLERWVMGDVDSSTGGTQ